VSTAIVSETFARNLPYVRLGLHNLAQHKVRSLLTMLGMIFGVAAVVAMLAIGAGAHEQVMAVIEQMGTRNLIVESKEAASYEQWHKTRQAGSPGLGFQDLRILLASVDGIVAATARKRMTPTRIVPRPPSALPIVWGVGANYRQIAGLRIVAGRFFEPDEDARAVPVCVLGEAAQAGLFPEGDPIGQPVKVGDVWLRVIGVAGPLRTAQTEMAGIPSVDLNNLIYVPLQTSLLRLEDGQSYFSDEVDGLYVQMEDAEATVAAGAAARSLLTAHHAAVPDFSVVVPSELLSEKRRTRRIFEAVTVAIASISLLVGGIGIMNIMLASVLERMREIGIRRAVGAARSDIARQFVIEAVLISLVGGAMGIVVGLGLSRVVAMLAGWPTIVTPWSVVLSFLVSISVGLVSGFYPALKASRLDPVEAIRR
jgi:putative ABC transport system permease protein